MGRRLLVRPTLASAALAGVLGTGRYGAEKLIHQRQAQQLTDVSRAAPRRRLFRVDHFFGTEPGLLKELPRAGASGTAGGLPAILDPTGASFDIMPPELRDRSTVALELSDGRAIARTVSALDEKVTPTVAIAQSSERLPLRAVVKVDRAALGTWAQGPYRPVMGPVAEARHALRRAAVADREPSGRSLANSTERSRRASSSRPSSRSSTSERAGQRAPGFSPAAFSPPAP